MIGSLTNDMIRLCGEIATLHENRGALRGSLEQGRKDLKETVSRMQADFHDSHGEMANRTKAELGEFIASVKDAVTSVSQRVTAFRGEIMEDMAGARRAWGGHMSGRTAFRPAPEEPSQSFAPKAKKKKR